MIRLTFAKMSEAKDYYRILNVKPSSTTGEIKNAYRKLAMKYHPDRNIDDALAAAIFIDVAEAYNILSDEEARKQYNYSRYLTAEQEYKKPTESIDTLILRIKKINEYARSVNKFHLNKDALLYSIKQLLPDDLDLLLNTNQILVEQFLQLVCETAAFLSFNQTNQLIILLQLLYNNYPQLEQQLQKLLRQQQKAERWEKNKIVLAVLIALILCIIIFFAANK